MIEPESHYDRMFARMCQQKKPHMTRKAAQQSIDWLRKKYPDTDPTLAVYQCDYCHLWHTGRSKYRRTESHGCEVE